MSALDNLAALMRQEWRREARCSGAYAEGDEFAGVIDHDTARDLIRRYCWRCPVVGPCREVADAGAPYKLHDYVAGARHYQRGEPRDGWPAQETA